MKATKKIQNQGILKSGSVTAYISELTKLYVEMSYKSILILLLSMIMMSVTQAYGYHDDKDDAQIDVFNSNCGFSYRDILDDQGEPVYKFDDLLREGANKNKAHICQDRKIRILVTADPDDLAQYVAKRSQDIGQPGRFGPPRFNWLFLDVTQNTTNVSHYGIGRNKNNYFNIFLFSIDNNPEFDILDDDGTPIPVTISETSLPLIARYDPDSAGVNEFNNIKGFALQAKKSTVKIKRKHDINSPTGITEKTKYHFKGKDGFRLKVKVETQGLPSHIRPPTAQENLPDGWAVESIPIFKWTFDGNGGVSNFPLIGSEDEAGLILGYFRTIYRINDPAAASAAVKKIKGMTESQCAAMPGKCHPDAIATILVNGVPINITTIRRVEVHLKSETMLHYENELIAPDDD